MDHRIALKAGTALPFPGMTCVIDRGVGRGSNALVYEGTYQDAMNPELRHRVLVKELFPYDPQGHIWRDDEGVIRRDEQGEELWRLHQLSFERGNTVHLQLLEAQPDQIGGNLNTFPLNGTYYTLLDYSGGRGMDKELAGGAPVELRKTLQRTMQLLHALEIFHGRGFLHLDISTDNVLLIGKGEQERVMLIDYNSVHTRQELLRHPNIYLSAKEGFTAPEVRTGMIGAIGERTDLFAVTAVLYACLMGQPPSVAQLSRKNPPDALDSALLADAPQTVRAQVKRIMARGFCVLPDKRYQSCAEMMRDLKELMDRLDGVGITHAALWEAGRKGVRRMLKQNPALAYVQQDAELYPLRVRPEGGETAPAEDYLKALPASVLLLGEGGMGKSTALMRTVLTATERYAPGETAVMYLPLFGWQPGENNYILDHILTELRFDASTRTMEDARRALKQLLGRSIVRRGEERAVLMLLLDGLNEAAGDAAGLVEEIGRLSALPGLRLVIASRTAPETLPMPRAAMVPLEEAEVGEALARHGLLMPESEPLRQLLRTPMMLSLFIRTAEGLDSQVLLSTEEELLDGYLKALCARQERDASLEARYQAEAAVNLVLPAIAREMIRLGHPLDDQALLGPVSRCYRVFGSGALSRAFPAWIGHSREILGDAGNAEEWYGQIVQNLLWRQLGLMVRDEAGCYHIQHQILQEYLAGMDEGNRARLRSQRARIAAAAVAAVTAIIVAAVTVYELWLKPKPYDEGHSRIVMDAATMQYVNCGMQYESMLALLDGADPAQCLKDVKMHGVVPSRTAELAMAALRESEGQVIPWSGQAFDFDSAEVLLALPWERAESYAMYIRAGEVALAGRTSTTWEEFSAALSELLEADADIAWLLDNMVCMPHVAAMSEQQRVSYDQGLLSLPAAQETRTLDMTRGAAYALKKAGERRDIALRKLSQLTVMYDRYVMEGAQ